MQKVSKIIALSAVFSLLLFAILGFGMSMSAHGESIMTGCHFEIGSMSFCTMEIEDHVEFWQDLFLSSPTTNLLLLILGIGLSAFFFLKVFSSREGPLTVLRFRQFYKIQRKIYLLRMGLFEALRSGIIQSKLYA